jgi:HSP20 family protein
MAKKNITVQNKKSTQGKNKDTSLREPEKQFLSLRDAMNRLLSESFWDPFDVMSEKSGMPTPLTENFFPQVDVSDYKDEIKVTANIPGVDPKDIDIEVDDESLFLRGKVEKKDEKKDEKYYRQERHYGEFRREIVLPAKVKSDKVSATAKDGVLTVIMPKAEEERKKKVKVKTQ